MFVVKKLCEDSFIREVWHGFGVIMNGLNQMIILVSLFIVAENWHRKWLMI